MFSRIVERFWYSQSPLIWLFWPLHLPFLALVSLKRAFYQYGVLKAQSFDKPVLVVGNLSIGGTGKTPFIVELVEMLAEKGIRVGIVSRGYKSSLSIFPHQVAEKDTAELVGDEPYMLYKKLAVPVVISPKRTEAVALLIQNNNVDIVISDDGMQHYAMGRDIEVLLFDGTRQFGNQLILPFGPLREPFSRLKSVDLVVQNGDQRNSYRAQKTTVKALSLVHIETKQERELDYLKQQEVVAIAGIGNPSRFFSSLEKIVQIKSKTIYPDHHPFSINDFDNVHEDKIVVMTEKDAVKCQSFAKKNWYYLKVKMVFEPSLTSQLEKLIARTIQDYK
jgi:tetraacyldisaccharide 4'-kinase